MLVGSAAQTGPAGVAVVGLGPCGVCSVFWALSVVVGLGACGVCSVVWAVSVDSLPTWAEVLGVGGVVGTSGAVDPGLVTEVGAEVPVSFSFSGVDGGEDSSSASPSSFPVGTTPVDGVESLATEAVV